MESRHFFKFDFARALKTALVLLLFQVQPVRAQPGAASSPSPPRPEESWKFGGDLRLRYESDLGRPGTSNRERDRYRLRLFARGPLSPEWELGVRMRTGLPHTPFAPNAPLYNSLGEQEASGFNVDQAYLLYHPQGQYGWQLGLGKSPKFFGEGDSYDGLTWAADYAPAGVWVAYEQPRWWLRAGYFTMASLPRYVGADLLALEGAYTFDLSSDSTLQLELKYRDFLLDQSVKPFVNRGNLLDGQQKFASDFRQLESHLSYNFHVEELPVSVNVFYARNLAARSLDNQAVSYGVSLGKTDQAGDLSVFGSYQILGQESLFSPVVQDDFLLSTNFRGFKAGVSYQLNDSCRVDAWMLTSAENGPNQPEQFRYRLDWNFRL